MKKYVKSFYATASIDVKKNGSARLVIRDLNGIKRHDKVHKNEKAAMSCWYRYNA